MEHNLPKHFIDGYTTYDCLWNTLFFRYIHIMGIDSGADVVEGTGPLNLVEQVSWGRLSKARWNNNVGATIIVTLGPLWMLMNCIALQYFDGSLTATIENLVSKGCVAFVLEHFPRPSISAFYAYSTWLIWQALLYVSLPGSLCFGQRTPGGYLLSYTANGLMAWTLTHITYLTASVLGLIDPAVIAKSWEGLFVAANTYGFVISIVAQWKGYWFPSFVEDRKLSGVSSGPQEVSLNFGTALTVHRFLGVRFLGRCKFKSLETFSISILKSFQGRAQSQIR